MSAVPAVTAQDLELETAELLPARETMVAGIDPGVPMRLYPGPVHYDPQPIYHWTPNPGGTYYPGPVHAWGE
jgi:hypothetical protein